MVALWEHYAGTVTARAEAQMLRLSVLYALADRSPVIDVVHLRAAEALWRYSEDSVRWIFGPADPVAARLAEAIRQAGECGLDGAGQQAVFGRHLSARELNEARATLEADGLVVTTTVPTGGRPRRVSRWTGPGGPLRQPPGQLRLASLFSQEHAAGVGRDNGPMSPPIADSRDETDHG